MAITYSLDGSRVLIVAGYTDQELLLRSKAKTKKQVSQPPAFLFEVRNVQVQPHRPSYEEFRSSDGLILSEKNCDEFAQVTMDILVHQNLSDAKADLVIDKNKSTVKMRVTDNSLPQDKEDKEDGILLGRYVRPNEFTDAYLEIRSDFFKELKGRPLTLVSPLFEAIPVAYIVDYDYSIAEGEEEATYSVTFQEVATTGF